MVYVYENMLWLLKNAEMMEEGHWFVTELEWVAGKLQIGGALTCADIHLYRPFAISCD